MELLWEHNRRSTVPCTNWLMSVSDPTMATHRLGFLSTLQPATARTKVPIDGGQDEDGGQSRPSQARGGRIPGMVMEGGVCIIPVLDSQSF